MFWNRKNKKCDSCGVSGRCVDEDIDRGVEIDTTKKLGLIRIWIVNPTEPEEIEDNENGIYLCESCHADLRGPDLSKWWLLK